MQNLYLITGADSFPVRQKAMEVASGFCGTPPEENPNLELIHGDSSELKPHEIIHEVINAVNTPAFFGDRKIIWLKRFDFSQIAKTNALKDAVASLGKLLKEGLPDDIILILDGTNLDRRSSFFKICQKTGEVHFFDKIDIRNNKTWEKNIRTAIMEKCKAEGLTIASDSIAFLTETAGGDHGRIISEIDKIQAFIHPRHNITIDDCHAICSRTPEAAGWAFADALGKKNLKNAMEALSILFSHKNTGIQVLYPVTNQFRELAAIKTGAAKLEIQDGINSYGFEVKLTNLHPQKKEQLKNHIILKAKPYRAWMLFSQAVKFTDSELSSILTAILKVNRQMVSGTCDPRIALELLAARICRSC